MLTARELEILEALRGGQPTKKIAKMIKNVTIQTVNVHLHNAMRKLDIHSRAALVSFVDSCHPEDLETYCQKRIDSLLLGRKGFVYFYFFPITKKTALFLLVCLIAIFFVFCTSKIRNCSVSHPFFLQQVRAELSIPERSKTLQRKHILKEIHHLFQGKEPIKIVALVGIGGAGKTILARQYAQTQQDSSVIWEINAETKETLLESFGDLAYALTHTQEEKAELERIKKIEYQQEYAKKLIYFVKQKMARYKNWFLIFDNVDQIDNIHEFLPTDSNVWGTGKILITTRNANIANSSFIEQRQVIAVEMLTHREKTELFLKIQETPQSNTKKLEDFCQVLPPFPLDITVAAYHLKNTGHSYDAYRKGLQDNDSTIGLLKETNNYAKTRQQIIAYSVDKMLQQREEFSGLLLLLSTLDSQNIPKELLKKYCDSTIVDQFVQDMRQSSLLNIKKEINTNVDSLSIHRSVQEMILSYLLHNLTEEKRKYHFQRITDVFCKYANEIIESLDSIKMRSLLPSLHSLSKHTSLYPSCHTQVNFQLGRIYYYFGDSAKTMTYMGSCLSFLRSNHNRQEKLLALLPKVLAYLGAVNMEVGNLNDAKQMIEESLAHCKTMVPFDQVGLAWTLLQFGWVARDTACYAGAKNAYERSIAIYTAHYGEQHPRTAWGFLRLGNTYSILGDTKKAKYFFNKILEIHKKTKNEDHINVLWSLFRLGTAYKQEGDYVRSLALHKESYQIYKEKHNGNKCLGAHILIGLKLGEMYRCLGLYEAAQNLLQATINSVNHSFAPNSIVTEWCMTYLARFYTDVGDYKTAQMILEKSLILHKMQRGDNHIDTVRVEYALAKVYFALHKIDQAEELYKKCLINYEKHYGSAHTKVARLLCDFACLYIHKKDFITAEMLLQKALPILKREKHAEIYRCYECLGDLWMAQNKVKKAKAAYKSAFMVARTNLPSKSAHITRLKSKLSFKERVGCCFQLFWRKNF